MLAIAAGFAAVEAQTERAWPRAQRMAFWINAYNFFTLHAIVDHYPIRGSWFSRYPQNSIRQIDGVWTRLTWRVAGRQVSLDDIEHRILRPEFKDPRIHFAVNCASLGCPPLRGEPYRAGTLDAQLDDNARQFLASPHGLRVDGRTLAVTSILKWYGGDFVERFARLAPGVRDPPAGRGWRGGDLRTSGGRRSGALAWRARALPRLRLGAQRHGRFSRSALPLRLVPGVGRQPCWRARLA